MIDFNTKMFYGVQPYKELKEKNKTYLTGTGVVWETKTTKENPIICCVCKGKTIMPDGFYPDKPLEKNPYCRTCKGKGITWKM